MTNSVMQQVSVVASAAAIAVATVGITPAQAVSHNFQFSFNDQGTRTPVSGSFTFNPTVKAIATPQGSFYRNASSSFSITVDGKVFRGSSNSMVVADNFQAPGRPGGDIIIFDTFSNFNLANPFSTTFLGFFIYTPDAWQSKNLPTRVPSTAFVSITTPNGVTLSSPAAFTRITQP
ncbi:MULTISPECIES: hypothetical protein [unclassified Coleofasciculus]|uniref:hypothetical protein n=1 Tax=unclassified Coleofasciculus TaxID=2692782 RepID=UPI0018811BB0|nr:MULTISPECIES: hypothetical protein [unclassified Coleofasciculus]MBE9126646.1 hypothetical protein [Coleofasciculus sp. LEGE 07081]MBE9148488.1 hypothetical protein [Coleofasciculus sp. LEGE 07092]